MSAIRRILFWTVLVGFVASLIGWLLHIPDYRRDPYRCVPAGANLMARAQDPGALLATLAQDPLMSSLVDAVALETNVLGSRATRDLGASLRRIARGDVLLARHPALGPDRTSAWLAVSWLGGESQRLRWWLKMGRVPGARRIHVQNGHVIWQIEAKGLPKDQVLTLTAPEGHLVLCLSRDPQALLDVVDAYDGLIPDSRAVALHQPIPEPGAGLCGIHWSASSGIDGWRWRLSWTNGNYAKLEAKGSRPARWPVPTGETNTAPVWNPASPHSILKLRADRALAAAAMRSIWGRVQSRFAPLMFEDAAGSVDVQLVQDPYGGRMRGLKVPTIVIGLPVESEAAATARIGVINDLGNKVDRWAVEARPFNAGPFQFNTVVGTGRTEYAAFAPGEQVAYLVTNGMCVIGSNRDAFARLLEYEGEHGTGNPTGPALDPTLLVDAWMDVGSGAKSFRSLLSLRSLTLGSKDEERTDAARDMIQRTKSVIDALVPVGEVRVQMRQQDSGLSLQIEAGRAI